MDRLGLGRWTIYTERTVTTLGFLMLSVAGSTGCREPDGGVGPTVQRAVVAGSVTLTYICGNSFRVRNTKATAVAVTWDVYQTTETGALTLPPKPASGPYSETYFTTVTKGTVRLFESGTLLQTKANGNKPPCSIGVRPAIPDQPNVPDDSTFVVADPDDAGTSYYRRQAWIQFSSGATDAVVAEFFTRFAAEVVGGVPATGTYYIRFPDPGPSWGQFDSLIHLMSDYPGVAVATEIARVLPKGPLEGRLPSDGIGFGRESWLPGSTSVMTWALRAIRAPLAWGCETGTYSPSRVRLAILEQAFESSPEFAGSTVTRVRASDPPPDVRRVPLSRDTLNLFTWHGKAVAGTLTASGNNDVGTAGVMWASDLLVYELTPPAGVQTNDLIAFAQKFVPDMIRKQPRVLSISAEIALRRPRSVAALRYALETLLDSVPGLLIVKAAGDGGSTIPAATGSADYSKAIRASLIQIVQGPRGGARILFVSGTQEGGEPWPGSDWLQGLTEVAAPAARVGVLGLAASGTPYSGDVVLGQGTSFSAPLVAGVAAQVLAMDGTRTPQNVKDLILRGAQVQRESPDSGALVSSQPVTGRTTFQLDAYGAVQLLSRERPGVPICGLELATDRDPVYGGLRSVIQRNTPEPVVADGFARRFTSVAQGGRLAADANTLYRLDAGTWVSGGAVPRATAVLFLEQDTAVVLETNSGGSTAPRSDLYLRIGSAKPERRVPAVLLTPPGAFPSGGGIFGGAAYDPYRLSISPSGDHVYFEWSWSIDSDCYDNVPATSGLTRILVALRGGPGFTFETSSGTNPPCSTPADQYPPPVDGPAGGLVAWAPDGTEFYYGRQYSISPPQLQRWSLGATIANTGPNVPLQANQILSLVWSPERARLYSAERQYTPDRCFLRTRSSTTPAAIVRDSMLGNFYFACANSSFGPNFLRTPGTVAEQSTRAVSSTRNTRSLVLNPKERRAALPTAGRVN